MIKAIYSEVLVINASYQITTILHFRRRGNHQQPTNTWTIKGNIIDKKTDHTSFKYWSAKMAIATHLFIV
jgi:hypothetical protein